jgi:uncharacterized protein YbjT (DUF2867 family)
MRILVPGATRALGRRLVPLLVSNGHTLGGTTRTPSKAEALRAAGATPVVLDRTGVYNIVDDDPAPVANGVVRLAQPAEHPVGAAAKGVESRLKAPHHSIGWSRS